MSVANLRPSQTLRVLPVAVLKGVQQLRRLVQPRARGEQRGAERGRVGVEWDAELALQIIRHGL